MASHFLKTGKMNQKHTLILGASTNPERYSFRAANQLMKHHHPVTLVGVKNGEVNNIPILRSIPTDLKIDTVTMYLSAKNQVGYYDDIIKLKPNRILFNPGAENPELEKLANENGIATEEACTLVLLSIGQY